MKNKIKKAWNGKNGWSLKLGSAILILGMLVSCNGFSEGFEEGIKEEEIEDVIKVGDKEFTQENLIRYVENLEKEVEQLRKAEQTYNVELTIDGEVKDFTDTELSEFVSEIMDENVNLQTELETTKTELETTKAELETTNAELETTKAELDEKEQTVKENVDEEIIEEEKVVENLTYEDLARRPEENEGKIVEFYGEIVQVSEGDLINTYRFAIDGDYDKIIILRLYNTQFKDRILEGDYLTITGISEGNVTYTTVLGASMTVPSVFASDYTIQ